MNIQPSNIDGNALLTDRLVLVSLRPSTRGRCRPRWPRPSCIASPAGAPSLEQLTKVHRQQVERADDPDVIWHNWVVRSRTIGSAVGNVHSTVTSDTAEIAGVSRQRQGVAVEAASAMYPWLATREVHRLTAHIHPDHVGSAKVAAGLGLVATSRTDAEAREARTSLPRTLASVTPLLLTAREP